ncbi:MAG: type II toxin-antitoxin system RelE/ParE family toxin [Anaerolineales bacterium]|nr:type II toxin-antitoxin system RelE/ParE family toxin [Anaerolineales bacterium]
MYEISLTQEAEQFYKKADLPLTKRLNRCFDLLRQNPFDHPNIKRLRGPLKGYFRFRVGNWRVVYEVDENSQQVIIYLIVHRSQAY